MICSNCIKDIDKLAGMFKIKTYKNLLIKIGLWGGLGGAVNALLCYAEIPVPVEDPAATFSWHVIPAGALHGSLLAIISIGCSIWLGRKRMIGQCLCLPIIGWGAGWLSWIPLQVSAFGDHSLVALLWPFKDINFDTLWVPYAIFGLVAVGYVFLLVIACQLYAKGMLRHVFVAALAGTLGSLWWWIEFGPWYFCVIHGTIWGSLVGTALSRWQQGNAR